MTPQLGLVEFISSWEGAEVSYAGLLGIPPLHFSLHRQGDWSDVEGTTLHCQACSRCSTGLGKRWEVKKGPLGAQLREQVAPTLMPALLGRGALVRMKRPALVCSKQRGS